MKPPSRCVECSSRELQPDEATYSKEIAGYTFESVLPVYTCKSCGERYWLFPQLRAFEQRVAEWLVNEGILDGEAFRLMRKVLGLKAIELAELLDITPETLSRWERRHRTPDRKAFSLLGTLVLDKLSGRDDTLRRMRTLRNPPQKQKRIDLTPAIQSSF